MAGSHADEKPVALMMTFFSAEQSAALQLPACHLIDHHGQQARVRLLISPEIPYFAGHFTDQPILPGITQIDWAIQIGRHLFAIDADFTGLHQLKFHRVITPDSQLELELEYQPEQLRLIFRITSTEGEHARGQVQFESRID